MIEGTINGFPFRAALEPNNNGSHSLRVNKALQAAPGADAGDTVTVEITRVGEEPELWVPTDLRKALEAARARTATVFGKALQHRRQNASLAWERR